MVEQFKENHENAKFIDFVFHNVNLVKKCILEFHFTTATDICMKEVIDSFPLKSICRKFLETQKALILTIIVLN